MSSVDTASAFTGYVRGTSMEGIQRKFGAEKVPCDSE